MPAKPCFFAVVGRDRDRVLFGDALPRRELAHVLRDPHKAEVRAAHRAEMRELGA
jgi:hypothetical protein